MYSFEGEFRKKPLQSLGGASKKEEKDTLLKRAQDERQKREDLRLQQESALKIQKVYRGFRVRQRQNDELRQQYDATIQTLPKGDVTAAVLSDLTVKLCHFYMDHLDGNRLIWLSQQLVKQKEAYISVLMSHPSHGQQQVKTLLNLCLKYLLNISTTSVPIAMPMRMLELFTAPSTYKQKSTLLAIWKHLINNRYFECMRELLNRKVPASLEKSSMPPTPVAASIHELIMAPISFAASLNDRLFSNHMLVLVSKTLLCPMYSEQIAQFLLPAMAYGKYPFPFVDLIQALITQTVGTPEGTEGGGKAGPSGGNIDWSPWLLGAFLTLGNKHIESMSNQDYTAYLQLLKRLLPRLPACRNQDDCDSSDSEEDMDISDGVCNIIKNLNGQPTEKRDPTTLGVNAVPDQTLYSHSLGPRL